MKKTFENTKSFLFSLENESNVDKIVPLFDLDYGNYPDQIIPQMLHLKNVEGTRLSYQEWLENEFTDDKVFVVGLTTVQVVAGKDRNVLESPTIFYPAFKGFPETSFLLSMNASPSTYRSNVLDNRTAYPLYKGVKFAYTVLANTTVYVHFDISATGSKKDLVLEKPGILINIGQYRLIDDWPILFNADDVHKKLDKIIELLQKS